MSFKALMPARCLWSFSDELCKLAKVTTDLQPHQSRVVQKLMEEDLPGLLVAHGLGSGKTLTSIAALDALGGEGAVVAPAALLENYRKEIAKHTDEEGPRPTLVSLQKATIDGKTPDADVLVVDEAHRARETSTKTYRTLKKNKAGKRVLLSASPFYNRPSDIAPLLNIAAGDQVLPTDRDFTERYVAEQKISPGLWGRIRGIKPGSVPGVNKRTQSELEQVFARWMDYHEGGKEGFPEVSYEDVKVPMTSSQRETYDTLMGQAPAWLRYKVRKGMPPSKQESRNLNAFMTGLRQVSLSTQPYITSGESEEAKVDAAFENLKKELATNKDGKVVVYSNYLEAGSGPYKKRLEAAGIPYGEFTGKAKKKEREQVIRDYNDGRTRVLLLSSAGGEGLDLKGTSVMQVLEPHWNQEKIKQVEGRAIRYKSHDHLPKEKQKVVVQRYLATLPRKGLLERMKVRDPGKGADEYLAMLSKQKEDLIESFRDIARKSGQVKMAGFLEELCKLAAAADPAAAAGTGMKPPPQIQQPKAMKPMAGIRPASFMSPPGLKMPRLPRLPNANLRTPKMALRMPRPWTRPGASR